MAWIFQVSSSDVSENALLMLEALGEWVDWFEMIERC